MSQAATILSQATGQHSSVGHWQRFLIRQGFSVGDKADDDWYGHDTSLATAAWKAEHGLQPFPPGAVSVEVMEAAEGMGYTQNEPPLSPEERAAAVVVPAGGEIPSGGLVASAVASVSQAVRAPKNALPLAIGLGVASVGLVLLALRRG